MKSKDGITEIVSIVIPVYNVQNYLKECLDSVINQTYHTLEIILIDDGSTDESGTICDEYARKDKRIKVIHQKNQGAAIAKNTGLDAVTGQFFMFVDSDDYLERDMIEDLVTKQQDTGADIVECGFFNEFFNRQEIVPIIDENEIKLSGVEYLEWYINHWTSSLLWNKLFKTELLQNIRFRYERRCIDDEFFTYKLVMNAEKVCIIQPSYYHYRKRKSSAVSRESNQRQITCDVLEMMEERYELISKVSNDLDELYLYKLNDFLLHMLNTFYMDETLVKETQRILSKYYYKTKRLKRSIRFKWYIKRIIQMDTGKLLQRNSYNTQHINDTLSEYYD